MDISTIAAYPQLSMYLARGWALVPLHDVAGGRCSCGRDCGKSAGKHPRLPEWQRPEHLVRDEAGLAAALERFGPSSNWGLATGLISGCWALDFDPKHVAPGEESVVAAVLEACWATATWVQRTGSGGLHFVFALPADFIPNNGSGSLPKGFDVRGARRGESGGGQIVLAPSVSGTGAYAVLQDRPPQLAPGIVTEAVRPAPPRPRSSGEVEKAITAAPDQIGRYVTSAINGELTALRACWTQRNQRAWTAAARCIEMINTGAVSGDAVYAVWWSAGLAHPDRSVTVPDAELLRVWASAERHVGDRPADLSGVGGPRGWGGDALYPSFAPPAPPLGGGGGAGPPASSPQGVHGGVDSEAQSPLDPVEALLAEMLDVEALRAVVPPQPLINGILDLDTTAWIIGESGSYKSFVTLDLAAHVGLGRPWRGHDVHQGEVVYIVAEGARGMRLRVDAWELEHGPMKAVRFLPRPVQASGPEWDVLTEALRRVGPALVVIDTQARVTLQLEENSNSDMGRYVERVDEIRRATGACVLTVHHTGRAGGNARGASALDGAQDTELKIVRGQQQFAVELHMDKQKDQAEQQPISIRLKRSEGGVDPATGRDLSSLVVDHAEAPPLAQAGETERDVSKRRALLMYQVVAKAGEHGGEGITRDAIKALFAAVPEVASLQPGARRMAATRAWNFLVSRGRVCRFGSSQRFGVFAPPDGATDGLLTINTGGPDDSPPAGWSIHWPESDKEKALGEPDAQ